MRTDIHITPNGGDPAEQALMEEFAGYLALLSKNATQPIIATMQEQLALLSKNGTQPLIAAMREHQKQLAECTLKLELHGEKQLAECLLRLEQHREKQSTLISRWMTLLLVILVAEGCVIVKLLIR
jgi:hypothetical protein